MSFAEWVALPEDEPGELVDGQLVEEEEPDAIHEVMLDLDAPWSEVERLGPESGEGTLGGSEIE